MSSKPIDYTSDDNKMVEENSHHHDLSLVHMYDTQTPPYLATFILIVTGLLNSGSTTEAVMMALCFLPDVHRPSFQAVLENSEKAKASFSVLSYLFANAPTGVGRGLPATYKMVLCGVILRQPWLVVTTNLMTYVYHQLNTGGLIRVNLAMNWDGRKFLHPAQGRDTNGLIG